MIAARQRGRAGHPAAPRPADLDPGGRRAARPQGRRRGVVRDHRRLRPGPPGQGRRDGRDRRPGLRDRSGAGAAGPARPPSASSRRGIVEPADLAPGPGRAAGGRSSGSGSPSAATGRGRIGAPSAGRGLGTAMADARPFHWEYNPEPVAREVFRIEGGRPLDGTVRVSGAKNAALKLLAARVLTGERCRFTNVPEIEDVRVMVATLCATSASSSTTRRPTSTRSRPATSTGCSSRSRRPPRCGPASSCSGPLLSRFGRVIISNPGGDRIGRRPVNLHVDAMRALGAEIEYRNGYYFAKAPGRLRGGEVDVPVRDRHGHRERDAGRHAWPTGRPRSSAGRPGARGRRPDRVPAEDGRRRSSGSPPTPIEVDGRRRLRGADHRVIPDRIEAGTFVVAAAVTGGHVTLRGRPVRAPRGVPGDARRDGRQRRLRPRHASRCDGIPPGEGDYRALRRRDRAVPGPRDRPPAAGQRAAHPGDRHEPRPRDDLRGPPGVARRAAPDGRPRGDRATRTMPRSPAPPACTAPRSRSATCGPARR